jgi:RimJ/RimL family protein N-acetyltransferase
MALVDPAGAVLGTASFMRINREHGTAEVGSIMYGPALARTRAATEAMTLMARHVFEDLGYRRYEWKCDALNAPSRKAAERLGFAFEGIWRNALVVKGRNRDTAWYAMTDQDWRLLAPAHAQWLAETHTSPQRRPLGELTRAALHPEP